MTFASFGDGPVETERERLKREAAELAARKAGYRAALEEEATGLKARICLHTRELDSVNERLTTGPEDSRLVMEADRARLIAAIDRLHGRIALVRTEQEHNK